MTSTTEFAKTWGRMKSNRSEEMNYEKMSRAMRYHYGCERQGRKGHLAMVKEKRLYYKWVDISKLPCSLLWFIDSSPLVDSHCLTLNLLLESRNASSVFKRWSGFSTFEKIVLIFLIILSSMIFLVMIPLVSSNKNKLNTILGKYYSKLLCV